VAPAAGPPNQSLYRGFITHNSFRFIYVNICLYILKAECKKYIYRTSIYINKFRKGAGGYFLIRRYYRRLSPAVFSLTHLRA